ncbi:putative metal chaperone, involved in Fe-nitrile hydratase activation, GTPase of COG0523 family [Marinobacterium lacunae]|uniref:Putative metal chaperone, involved in Fe-nitrile hydratase activation, GTPase of COG0523 family n=1 Tax=Marinobacterium lacunae TaxID=1232683 RepID=A0A081FWZ3_9GAMM|nr:putative metal chaperone, involved in Fe-nitrile hydratase activation, GTPase of COG0523 family [Marinobacterium lacunae]
MFDHPWQAQAFSLIVHLHRSGLFAWPEWVKVFSDVIKSAPPQPGESDNDTYYRQWIVAMEQMVASLGLVGEEDIAQRAHEWRQAYLNTPHGQPILLANASCAPAHDHHHTPTRAPVAVSPASSC